MRHDTKERRAWILANLETATVREAATRWDVSDTLIRHDERAMGVRLRRSHPTRHPGKRPGNPVIDQSNALAGAFLRGRL